LKRYEIMFLFDNAVVHEWSEMEAEVKRLYERIGAEPLVTVKYDERKLAYEINGRKRGTYVLSYFDADPDKISALERDVKLSEVLLRAMVLKGDSLTEERLAELREHKADTSLQPVSNEGRRGDGYGRSQHGPSKYSPANGADKHDAPPTESADADTTAAPVATATPPEPESLAADEPNPPEEPTSEQV